MRMDVGRWVVAVALAAGLAGCGGGGGGSGAADATATVTPATGVATLGAAGGTVQASGGAAVVVPAGAASAPVTVRIAKDATDMPALPARLKPVGDVWTVTPHGAVFSEPVRVQLPPAVRAMAANERLRIAKVSPGGEWELLDPAVEGDTLAVTVRSFSYFVPVAEAYAQGTATVPPFAATLQSVACDPGPCNAVVPDSTNVSITVVTNDGALPVGCGEAFLSFGWGPAGSGAMALGHAVTAGRTTYQFQPTAITLNTTRPTGERLGLRQVDFGISLLCSGPPRTLAALASAQVVFPAKSASTQGALEPPFAVAAAALSCNNGPCLNLTGNQSVRLRVRVAPGVLMSSSCPANDRLVVTTNVWGGAILGTAAGATAASGTPARSVGGDFSFAVPAAGLSDSFNVLAPVPATAVPLYVARVCTDATGTHFNSAEILQTLTLPFITPQQATPPSLTTQPRPMSVRAGQTASFTAVVTGFPAPALQWQTRLRDTDAWADVPGATAATLTTAPAALADNGRQFKLVASNSSGRVDSNVVTLSVYLEETVPVISHQPQALSVVTGSDAAFAVAASGTGALSYQWQFNGQPLTGANAPVLKLSAAGPAQAGSYRVVVSNAAGTVTSDAAVLTVGAVPLAPVTEVVVSYASMTVAHGAQVVLTAGKQPSSGSDTLQWYRNGVGIPGATSSSLVIASATDLDAGVYSVRVGGLGPVAVADLHVVAGAASSPVSIAVHPAPQVQAPQGSATFAVAASGSGPLNYQWLKDGSPVPGATQPVLVLPAVTAADVGSYSVRVGNALGTVTSNAAPLVVLGAPALVSQPAAQSVVEGATATFSIAASGGGLRYQWLKDRVAIVGATGASYTTPALTLADSGGVYSVIVYNGAGLVFSQGALLTVTAAPAPQAVFGKLAGYADHYCAVRSNGTLACWGEGTAGQLGTGSLVSANSPQAVVGLAQVSAVAVGGNSSCAIHGADVLSCWGALRGQATPQAVFASPTPVAAVAVGTDSTTNAPVGRDYGCLVYKNAAASVACWGDRNDFGQLGGEPSAPKPVPADVLMADGSVLQDVAEIAAGDAMSCALQRSGAVWCWGMDMFFQVRTTPQRVTLLSGTPLVGRSGLVVGASQPHACVLGDGGSVWCWGFNGNAELGDGTTSSRNTAAQPTGLSGVLALAAGPSHTCALSAAGVQCWGLQFMGNGGALQSLTTPGPTGVVAALAGAGSPVIGLAPGSGGNCVLRADGHVLCWGPNNVGQLGTGDLLDRLVPTPTTAGAVFGGP